MSEINYQALRMVADKAGKDEWELRDLSGILFVVRRNSYEKRYGVTSFQSVAEIEDEQVAEFVSLANPATVLAMLDELAAAKSRLIEQREYYEGVIADGSKRIAELEAIKSAAEKLVSSKGRYHSEQNYRALAALFGVTIPDLPPLQADN
ncbi:ead/Ea22-like family protein [Escherichia coli]|nr:ead/Ea22-like family protein [Escherichia coli]EJK1462156.1 ead/Ea22-like family protein [Escherichia coli]EJK1790317.1 ead/Ea22-like family protein [Escherichia coli]ELE2988871.1 ead/Ea22-like family protein [Escherichia coli]ELE3012779.1 ead/Ea22-like family protein [Escherichia coli]